MQIDFSITMYVIFMLLLILTVHTVHLSIHLHRDVTSIVPILVSGQKNASIEYATSLLQEDRESYHRYEIWRYVEKIKYPQ